MLRQAITKTGAFGRGASPGTSDDVCMWVYTTQQACDTLLLAGPCRQRYASDLSGQAWSLDGRSTHQHAISVPLLGGGASAELLLNHSALSDSLHH